METKQRYNVNERRAILESLMGIAPDIRVQLLESRGLNEKTIGRWNAEFARRAQQINDATADADRSGQADSEPLRTADPQTTRRVATKNIQLIFNIALGIMLHDMDGIQPVTE
jgi:hypothetical protein